MAIKMMDLNANFLEEGTYTFKVMDAEYNEKFEKLKIKFKTNTGAYYSEHFTMMDGSKKPVEWQIKKMTLFVKTLMNDNTLTSLTQEVVAQLKGKEMTATVKHFKADNGNTYVNLNNLQSKASDRPNDVKNEEEFELPFDV